jgi:hypothetical protein
MTQPLVRRTSNLPEFLMLYSLALIIYLKYG